MPETAEVLPENVRFFVVGEGRSGTTWLADLIRQHSGAACLMEPMQLQTKERLNNHHEYWKDDDIWICPRAEKPCGTYADVGEYLEKKVWTLRAAACGAKMMNEYFYWYPQLAAYLKANPTIHVIHITRNPLRVALSLWYAVSLNNWNTQRRDAIRSRDAREFTWEELEGCLKRRTRHDKILPKLFGESPVLQLEYASLLHKQQETMARVWKFLRLPPVRTASYFRRMTPQPLKELMLNWEALRAETPECWQHYWDEPLD